MTEREEFLDGSAKTIQSKRQEIENHQQAYQEKLTDARQNAHELITRQVQQAKSEKEELLNVVSEETSKRLQSAKEKMNSEAEATRKELAKEVNLTAELIFNKLTGLKGAETAPPKKAKVSGAKGAK